MSMALRLLESRWAAELLQFSLMRIEKYFELSEAE